MESAAENLCSVIQYYKGPSASNAEVTLPNSFESKSSVADLKVKSIQNNRENVIIKQGKVNDHNQQNIINTVNEKSESEVQGNSKTDEANVENVENIIQSEFKIKDEIRKNARESDDSIKKVLKSSKNESGLEPYDKPESKTLKTGVSESSKLENNSSDIVKLKCELETKDVKSEIVVNENEFSIKGKKRTLSEANVNSESVGASNAAAEEAEANEEELESDEDDDEVGHKPRRRGRCKKNPDIIPPHLSSDMVLGYKILLKFLETPQFSGFHKPFKKSQESEKSKITCLNQIKKKFEENLYNKISEFVNDVREMLINIYESRNQVAIKKALRLEQILEQRIAQLPNYLRPKCALVLSPEEDNNTHNKIRITKGGGFVSLLLEKTEKKRYEKNREKRKLLAEERKQLKEEQDKDVQEWEKNVLLKDFEEDIKSMWELPAIGHYIHLCADILNIGEVAQFEVERMLLMPQCSDTLDLIMTALLTNSLIRARLDRTPSMPYSIWGPLVRTRIMSWYRMWHRAYKNEQKIFEEVGIEPEFWQVLGPDINPLEYYNFHEISLLQRVWVLKTLCDVDFVKKKTVYDNIRAQTLDELNPVYLGLDLQGNRYIQFKQFCGSDIRIYRQSTKIEDDITPAELIESFEGFESREGPITADKVFRDIWEMPEKQQIKRKKRRKAKNKQRTRSYNIKFPIEGVEKRNLRVSAREKKKTYVDSSDSDQSDTDLRTLRDKLLKSEADTLYRPFSNKEFISLSVFRLPREKLNKQAIKRSSYVGRRTEEAVRIDGSSTDKPSKAEESEDRKEDAKPAACEDEQSDSLDSKQMQIIQADFEKTFHGDDLNEDEFDLGEKMSNCELDNSDANFSVKNLEQLKMVFKKDSSPGEEDAEENLQGKLKSKDSASVTDKDYDALNKYSIPDHLKPDSSKFYLVVDSVEGLRQLISKFGSHENDLEIITRSTKSKKKSQNTSCEVRLIEKLQNLLLELEPWELDLMKSCRSNREKMYKEYMNFINRPPDFVHPNEAYWMKNYEEPSVTTSTTTATCTTVTVTTAESNSANGDKSSKEGGTTTESTDVSQQNFVSDVIGLRKRTRTTRVQLQPESDELDEDFEDVDDYESNGSDDNWVLPTPKKRIRKEPAARPPRLPRRSSNRRAKSSSFEKTESQGNSGEKSHSSSPEKVKKALFWGPRSTDPSEDLNWETNRQKILEQHNSPIKKLLKSEETNNDLPEAENTRKKTQTVIMASPKRRIPPPIPGNKKPYFTAAQLKNMENQARKEESGEVQRRIICSNVPKQEAKNPGSNPSSGQSTEERDRKIAIKMQTYTRIRKAEPAQPAVSAQPANRIVQPPQRQASVVVTSSGVTSQVVRYATQVCTISSGVKIEQKPLVQVQIRQPGARPQKAILDVAQNRVITATPRTEDSEQWQQKDGNNQSGKTVQKPGKGQTQSQNQSQGQGQSQESGKESAAQQSGDKTGSFIKVVSSEDETSTNPEGELFVMDGKNVMKLDSNLVQQLPKEQVMNLDFKKTLLLVKQKLEPSAGTSQDQDPNRGSPQSILVINKTAPIQQTVSTASVPNFMFPANYIIEETGQHTQGEQGTVKIVQQSPAYMIQQKSVLNKPMQPQVIKIITSQPMGTNQNLILAPVASQVIQPMTQTVMTPDQQTKPTLRLIKSHAASGLSNAGQCETNSEQGPIIVNNIVQIQGQTLDASEPQTQVVQGRIVSAAVPSVHMAAPQADDFSVDAQTELNTEDITPGVRLAAYPPAQIQPSKSSNPYPRIVLPSTQTVRMVPTTKSQMQTSASLNQGQTTRITTSPQQNATATATSNVQVLKPSNVTVQQLRLAVSQPQTVIQTAHPQIVQPGTISAQTVQVVSHPQILQTEPLVSSEGEIVDVAPQYQTQTVVPCMDLNSQSVSIATAMDPQSIGFVQSQPVSFITNNNMGVEFINRSPASVKATVITSGAQNPMMEMSSISPTGMVCQPVQYQAIVQGPGLQPIQAGMEYLGPQEEISAETIANAPIIFVEEDQGVRVMEENPAEIPVMLDYINGELSIKKTSQGWKYAVRASNGKDIILTDEQIEERLNANNGVMQ